MDGIDELVQLVALGIGEETRLLVAAGVVNVHAGHGCGVCVDVDACLRWVVAGPRFQGCLCDEGEWDEQQSAVGDGEGCLFGVGE